MKILVTGANGFVGSALCALLLSKGYEINYLTTSYKKIKNTPNFKGFLWKPHNNEIDLTCLKGVEVIVNLAGHTINCKWTKRNKALIYDSRMECSNVLYRSLKENSHTVKHIIHASAIGIYKSSETALYDEESTNFGTDFLADVCVNWENMNERFSNLGIKNTKVRFGLILSKDEGVLHELAKVTALGLGAPLGNGKQWMSWIHFEDVIQIIKHIIDYELTGIYNVVGPKPVLQIDFLRALAHQLQKKLWLPNVPEFLIKMALGERSSLVLSSQKVKALKIESNGYQFKFIDLNSALKDLYHS